MCGRRAADLAYRHLAESTHQAVLPFGWQRLPDRTGKPIAHRVIQASAPRRTALEYQVWAARRFVSNYQRCLLWDIEQVFRTLKSAAMQADDSQVTQARRFVKLAVVALIAAVRIMQIVIGRDGKTGQALADAMDPVHQPALTALNRTLEGRTEKLKNPHPSGSLAWFSWIVARLGGWSGYTSRGYKPAGPKTIARGLARLDGFIGGWALRSADMRLP